MRSREKEEVVLTIADTSLFWFNSGTVTPIILLVHYLRRKDKIICLHWSTLYNVLFCHRDNVIQFLKKPKILPACLDIRPSSDVLTSRTPSLLSCHPVVWLWYCYWTKVWFGVKLVVLCNSWGTPYFWHVKTAVDFYQSQTCSYLVWGMRGAMSDAALKGYWLHRVKDLTVLLSLDRKVLAHYL